MEGLERSWDCGGALQAARSLPWPQFLQYARLLKRTRLLVMESDGEEEADEIPAPDFYLTDFSTMGRHEMLFFPPHLSLSLITTHT